MKNLKPILIILGILGSGIAIYFIHKKMNPIFYFEEIDHLNKKGIFSFEGKLNSFDINKSGSIRGKKYILVYGPKNGKYSFDLYEGDNLYKNLQTIFT